MAKINRSENVPVANREAIQNEISLMTNVEDIETRLAVEPRHQRFAQLADAYLALDEMDEAIRLCTEGLKQFPHYGTASLILAKAFNQKGDRVHAVSLLQEYLSTHPSSLVAHKMMGELAVEEKNLRKAVKHYRIALRLDPVNRNLIQQFVEVRDEFQKIKDSVPSDDEELDDEKPIINKTGLYKTEPVRTIDRVLDEVLEMPAEFKESEIDIHEKKLLIEESSAESFMMEPEPVSEIIPEPTQEKFETKTQPITQTTKPFESKIMTEETQDLLHDDEAEHIMPKPAIQPAPIDGMNPVYVDEKGVMYFYDDDEVSFDQYKIRFDLQKQGKAKIMNRARLDERMALLGIAEPAQRFETVEEKTESIVDEAFKSFASELTEIKTPEPAPADIIEEPRQSTVVTEPVPESDDVETAFEDMEISYKDYLEILVEEEELLEALMSEDSQDQITEEISIDLISKIVNSADTEEFVEPKITDHPVSYKDYLSSLTDPEDLRNADLSGKPPIATEAEERILSLTEFALELDLNDELIDFRTFQLLSPTETDDAFLSSPVEPVESVEPGINYNDYLISLVSDEDQSEASLAGPIAEVSEIIAEPVRDVIDEEKTEPLYIIEPAIEKENVETITTLTESQPDLSERTGQAEKVKPETAVAEAIAEEKEMAQEEEFSEDADTEEEIDPRKASLELVDQLSQFGQFGTAYKVCKMLKLKNPTDAKIDRKILELKRLYLWSSQLVG